jgi:hypothetical protein
MSQTLFGDEEIDERGALISDDGLYRYVLGRRWARDGQIATFVMLNPSTADATEDDPTIRRCVGFAKSWGMAALHVVNLYALRSTDPKGLWRVADPVGPENDRHLTSHARAACTNSSPLIAAWGANAKPDRVAQVLALPGMVALEALGVTKDGAPRHPLYLRADSERVPYRWPGMHFSSLSARAGVDRPGFSSR